MGSELSIRPYSSADEARVWEIHERATAAVDAFADPDGVEGGVATDPAEHARESRILAERGVYLVGEIDGGDATESDRDGESQVDRNGKTESDRDGESQIDRNGKTESDRDGESQVDRNGKTESDRDGKTMVDRDSGSQVGSEGGVESGHTIVATGALEPDGGAGMAERDASAELTRMRVDPDYWRQGYGREMLEALERSAREHGWGTLVLETLARQEAARSLYESAGYEAIDREVSGEYDVRRYRKTLFG